jgi:hypothetical protein
MHSLQIYWWTVAVEVATYESKLAQSQGSHWSYRSSSPKREDPTLSARSKLCHRST